VTSKEGDVSTMEMLPEFEEGLYRLEMLKELDVIFLLDRSEGFDLKLHPRGDPDIPLAGVFGTRSPRRPNPLGLTRAKLLEVKGLTIKMEGLDAFLDTPIIDIKGVVGKEFSWSSLKKPSGAGRPAVRQPHK